LLGHHLNAEVTRTTEVGSRKPDSSFGDRTIGNHLHATDADPFISEAGVNARRKHPIALQNCFLDFRNRAQIAVHLSEAHQTCFSGVSVRINKSRNNSAAFEIYLLGFA
jgi:hypothetical protein